MAANAHRILVFKLEIAKPNSPRKNQNLPRDSHPSLVKTDRGLPRDSLLNPETKDRGFQKVRRGKKHTNTPLVKTKRPSRSRGHLAQRAQIRGRMRKPMPDIK